MSKKIRFSKAVRAGLAEITASYGDAAESTDKSQAIAWIQAKLEAYSNKPAKVVGTVESVG